jgi:hypothetical protein
MHAVVIDSRQYDWKKIRRLRREQIQEGHSTCLTEEC